MATVPRSPLYTRLGALYPYAALITSQPLNLPLNVVSTPSSFDWPNPVLPKPNFELRTWLQPAGPIRLPANTKPPVCLDFPNPVLAKPNLELRTWTQSVGTLRMPAVVKVPTGTTYDRSNPVLREYRSIYSFVSEMNDEVIPPPTISGTGNGSSNPHPKHFRSMRNTRGRR